MRGRRGGTSAGRTNTRVRSDPSGEIARSLTELIERGHTITRGLATLAREDAVNGHAKTIEDWRIACLQTLHAGFEREAAVEFLHASHPTIIRRQQHTSVKSQIQQMKDALALLHTLNDSLKRRRRVAARRHGGELRGFASGASSALGGETPAPRED